MRERRGSDCRQAACSVTSSRTCLSARSTPHRPVPSLSHRETKSGRRVASPCPAPTPTETAPVAKRPRAWSGTASRLDCSRSATMRSSQSRSRGDPCPRHQIALAPSQAEVVIAPDIHEALLDRTGASVKDSRRRGCALLPQASRVDQSTSAAGHRVVQPGRRSRPTGDGVR